MRTGMLGSILDELAEVCGGFAAAWVGTTDGLTLASRGLSDSGEDTFGSLSSSLVTLGGQIAADFVGSDCGEVLVQGGDGILVAVPAGPELVLAMLAPVDQGTGVIPEMQRAAGRIATLFGKPEQPVSD